MPKSVKLIFKKGSKIFKKPKELKKYPYVIYIKFNLMIDIFFT